MDIEAHLQPELWRTIANSYQAGNFTHAIRDAMSLVTETLRDKSGQDGDGEALAGKALGFSEGKAPLVRINKFQTQSEQDEQRGLMTVIRGLYSLVRNPRNHERLSDTQETADKIILFIDYLLGLLGASQQSFTVEGFVDSVKEEHFVDDTEYVDELVNTIPPRKLGDTLIALYREKNWQQGNRFAMVIAAILSRMQDGQVIDFLAVVSDELMKVQTASDVTLVIRVVSAILWPRLTKMARLRAENILLETLRTAWYTPKAAKTMGIEATWLRPIHKHLVHKEKLQQAILELLYHGDFDYSNFVARYYLRDLPEIFPRCDEKKDEVIRLLGDSVRGGNPYMKTQLVGWLKKAAPGDWVSGVASTLSDLTDETDPELYLPENGDSSSETIPFLGRFVEKDNPGDIPF
jgi:uncharacterized protein (TIGR02391 family)